MKRIVIITAMVFLAAGIVTAQDEANEITDFRFFSGHAAHEAVLIIEIGYFEFARW